MALRHRTAPLRDLAHPLPANQPVTVNVTAGGRASVPRPLTSDLLGGSRSPTTGGGISQVGGGASDTPAAKAPSASRSPRVVRPGAVNLSITKTGGGQAEIDVFDAVTYAMVLLCNIYVTSCSGTFSTNVVLVVLPGDGSYFNSWSGDCAGAVCLLDPSADRSVTATIDLQPSSGPPGVQASDSDTVLNDETQAGCTRPCLPIADPSIAVNATETLSSVMGWYAVRLRGLPFVLGGSTSDFFDNNGAPADTRVLWDAVTSRWYMAQVEGPCQATLGVAVSDSADAFGAWSVYSTALPFGSTTLSMSETNDKLVMAVQSFLPHQYGTNPYCPSGSQSEVVVVDTATLATAPVSLPFATETLTAGLVDPVAVTGTGGQGEALVVAGLTVFRIQGTVASSLTMTSDQIGPFYVVSWSAAILDGTDLWLLSNTCQSDPGLSPPVACIQVYEIGGLDTSTLTETQVIQPPDGSYDGEIGVAADGTLFLVYSQDLPGFAAGGGVYVTIHRTGDALGLLRPRSLVVQAGYGPRPASTASALPPDPTDAHAVWQATEADDVADAGWTVWTSMLDGDADAAPDGTVTIPPTPQPNIFLDHAVLPVPAPGTGETYMRVSDSPTFSAAVSMPIPSVLPWSMDDQAAGGSKTTGLRTVYVQFGDGLGDWSATTTATVTLDASIPDTRLAGANRYETAAALSRDTFLPGVPYAFIATGLNYPDAMAGGAVAGELGAPLLFVSQTMPAATLAELQRLQPGTIVILGSTGVVSTAIEDQLRTLATTGNVIRLAGSDRYSTAAAVSAWAYPNGAPVALIAYGSNYPDALAAGPAAGLFGLPILYAGKTAPAATMNELKRLKPEYIIVLGGPGNIPDAVALQLATASTDNIAYRLAGSDRYGTAAAIDAWAFPYGSDGAFVTTGLNFPDALAASAVGAWTAHPIVYTSSIVPAATASTLAALKPQQYWIMGSTGAVSASVVNALNAYLVP